MTLYYAQALNPKTEPDGQTRWEPPHPYLITLLNRVPLYQSHQQYQTIQQVEPVPPETLPAIGVEPDTPVYPTPDGYCILQPVQWNDIVTLANYCLRGDQYWIDYETALTVATLEEHYGENLETLRHDLFHPSEETLVDEFLTAVRQFFK